MEGAEPPCPSSPLATSLPEGAVALDPTRDTFSPRPNAVSTVVLYGVPIVSLVIDGIQRLCLAQISNTLLKEFSYNEIHNRRVALGITCVQCTPVQLEILRRAGAMPISSRRCGMITKREAERLCKSFLGDNAPPQLPDNFVFEVLHECAWGCRGGFVPSRYNSSRAKCIKCVYCSIFFSPNKFVFHSHRLAESKYIQPDAANFNSWRRHIRLYGEPVEEVIFAWEDVKAMFNGGTRKRLMSHSNSSGKMSKQQRISTPPLGKSPPMTGSALKHSEMGSYGPYLGGITPLPPHYPNPSPHKNLDMRQSFVDYLWSSRSGIPPLGFPYPLSWPKRPLPSLPGLGISNGDVTFDGRDHPDLLRAAPASAFTPVSSSGTSPNDQSDHRHNHHPDMKGPDDDPHSDATEAEDDVHDGKEKVKRAEQDASASEKITSYNGASSSSSCKNDQDGTRTRAKSITDERRTPQLESTEENDDDEEEDEEGKEVEENKRCLSIPGSKTQSRCQLKVHVKKHLECPDEVSKPSVHLNELKSDDEAPREDEDIDVTNDCTPSTSPRPAMKDMDLVSVKYPHRKTPSPPALFPAPPPPHTASSHCSNFSVTDHILQNSASSIADSRGPLSPRDSSPPLLTVPSLMVPHSLSSPPSLHNPHNQLSPISPQGFPATLALTSMASNLSPSLSLSSPFSSTSFSSLSSAGLASGIPGLGSSLPGLSSSLSSGLAVSLGTCSTQSLLSSAEDDPRLRLLFLREFEARRRMELEMTRVKLAHPAALHPAMHHPHHPAHPSSAHHHHAAPPPPQPPHPSFHHQALLSSPLGHSPLSSPLSPHHLSSSFASQLGGSLSTQLGSPLSAQISPTHHPHHILPPQASPTSPAAVAAAAAAAAAHHHHHSHHHMATAALTSLQHHTLSKDWMESAAAVGNTH